MRCLSTRPFCAALTLALVIISGCRILDEPSDVPLFHLDMAPETRDMSTGQPDGGELTDAMMDLDASDNQDMPVDDMSTSDASTAMDAARSDADLMDVDMAPLPGPYGDVCPGSFAPPPRQSEDCDLIGQNCPPGPMDAATICEVALVEFSPPQFAARCFQDDAAEFVLGAGEDCDPSSSELKCSKGLDCSHLNGENRCRRYCILSDARGCDPQTIRSNCAPTGLTPLDSLGIGFCASACDAFQ